MQKSKTFISLKIFIFNQFDYQIFDYSEMMISKMCSIRTRELLDKLLPLSQKVYARNLRISGILVNDHVS